MKQKHTKIILVRAICIQKIKTGHEVPNQDPTNKLLLRHPSRQNPGGGVYLYFLKHEFEASIYHKRTAEGSLHYVLSVHITSSAILV